MGPKLVVRDNPDVLLEVGMSIDHYGVPFAGIEPDEVDQEQHDGVRDVFYVSHATMLVRADLFHELGGFDPATGPGSDDIDLCWRARLAGARVIVAPDARVRHGRDGGAESSQPVDGRSRDEHGRARLGRIGSVSELRAETRSRIRLLFKSYSALALVWVLPVAFALSLFEAIGLAITGKVARARAVIVGWLSAFAHPGELRRARSTTQHMRRVDDADVRDLMIRGSARLRRFMLERVHAGERLADVSSRTRVHMDDAARRVRQLPAIFAVTLAVLILFGSRTLLSGHVPEVGSFQAWPGVGAAWSTFSGSWRTTMMGTGRPATPAFGLIALAGSVLFGHPGLARSLVVGGALPLGAFGAYRLVRPFSASSLPGIAAAGAYAANPIARNAIFQGELGPLVCFALAPYVLDAFVRVTNDTTLAATAASGTDATRRHRIHVVCSVALLVAVVGSVWPPALLLAPVIAIAICVALPFTGGARRAGLAASGAGAATVVSALLLAPWLFSLFGADAASLGAQPRASLSFATILRFHTARAGAGIAPWGIIAAAVVPLAIATGPRLRWAMRAWMLAMISFAIAWLPGRLSAGATSLAPDGVLVAAAIGLAFAAGLGIAAVLDDLRRFRFGWRQVMLIVAFAGLLLAVLGFSADTFSGRYGLRAADWPGTYSWMTDNPPVGGFRVLWIGDPNILPADAKVSGDVGFALTRSGPGDARASWAAPEQHADRVLAGMISSAASDTTVRLGHLLAPAGVRYVAFVTRAAPKSGLVGRDERPIADALARQLDLSLSRLDDSGVVYENDAWIPMHAVVPKGDDAVHVDGRDPRQAAIRSEPDGVIGVGSDPAKAVGPGTLLWSEAADPNWVATSRGTSLVRRDAFGLTNAFALDASAPVRVRYAGSTLLGWARAAQIALWVVVLAVWFATRRSRIVARSLARRPTDSVPADPAGVDPHPVDSPVGA